MDLDEAVVVALIRRSEDDQEDVTVVVVDLGPLAELPGVLERERVEAELLAQDLEVARHGLLDVEPEERVVVEQLADAPPLEMQPVRSAAVDHVVTAPPAAMRRWYGRYAVTTVGSEPWTSTPSS